MKKHDWDSEHTPLPQRFIGLFDYSRRALQLVWSTRRDLTLLLAALTLIAGVLPAVAAWVGRLIVDAVVAAIDVQRQTGAADTTRVLLFVALEAVVIAVSPAPSAASPPARRCCGR